MPETNQVETAKTDGDKELSWDREPFPQWKETVEGWPWRQIAEGLWEKSGACLRCGHGMDVRLGDDGAVVGAVMDPDDMEAVLIELSDRADGIVISLDKQTLAWCRCTDPHPGRPPGLERGCGQRAWIDLPVGYEPPSD